MKTKQELEIIIKDNIIKFKYIIFESDPPIFTECLNEFKKQQINDESVYD